MDVDLTNLGGHTGKSTGGRDGMGVSPGSPNGNGVSQSASPADSEDSDQSSSEQEQRVPYERFSKVTEENKKLRQELEEARKTRETDDLRSLLDSINNKVEAGETSFTKAQIEMIQRHTTRAAVSEFVQANYPDMSPKQERAVVDILTELGRTKGFTVEDAVAVAARRNPDLFARRSSDEEEGKPRAAAGSFAASRPGEVSKGAPKLEGELRDAMAAFDAERNQATKMRLAARINRLRDEIAQTRRR